MPKLAESWWDLNDDGRTVVANNRLKCQSNGEITETKHVHAQHYQKQHQQLRAVLCKRFFGGMVECWNGVMMGFHSMQIHENGGMVAWKRLKISLWGLTSPNIYS